MDVRVGVLILFVLSVSWACHARQLSDSDVKVYLQKEVQASEEIYRNDNVCTLCEEFAAEALDYLSENKTQTEIIDTLHITCSRIPSFKQQCITLVDYYAPLFFLEVSSVQPADFCRKVNLCEQIAIFSSQLHEDSCGLCQRTVSEVLVKLKDPDTQLEILELLLKGCNSLEKYVKKVKEVKCKRMVFEYGPIILANTEQFLEKNDLCTMLHACSSSTASSVQASQEVNVSVLADS